MLPEIIGLKHKIKNKFEIEKYVHIKNNTLDKFKRKWTINCNLLLNIQYFFLVGIILCHGLGSDFLKLINYSYGYKPIGVPNFGQVHVS